MPPFLSVSMDLEVDRFFKGIFAKSAALQIAPQLFASTLKAILEDQFTDGNAAGAWSRQYSGYIRFFYDGSLPIDVAVRDTISYSAWIATSLCNCRRHFSESDLTSAVAPRLTAFRDYLHRHFDKESGGFGLVGPARTRGPGHIQADLRHTAWAMLALRNLEANDQHSMEMLTRGAEYVRRALSAGKATNERAITAAAVHKLLSTEELKNLVCPSERTRHADLKRIEAKLVEDFDKEFVTWDSRFDRPDRASIDNALYVLYCIPANGCVDAQCSKILLQTLHHLIENALVDTGSGSAGLPFARGREPNVGTTAFVLSLLLRDRASIKPSRKLLGRLTRFLNTPETQTPAVEVGFPWQRAAILDLAAGG